MSDLNTIDTDINQFLTAHVGGETKELIEFYKMKLERATMHIGLLQSLKDFKGEGLVGAKLLTDVEIEVVKSALEYLLQSRTNVLAVLRLFTDSMLLTMDNSIFDHTAPDPTLNRYKVMVSVNTILKEADYWHDHDRPWWKDILSNNQPKQHFTDLFSRANGDHEEPAVRGTIIRRLSMQKLTS